MNILLTGVTGYIGRRLLPLLVADGHKVYCCTRDKDRFEIEPSLRANIEVVEIDFLKKELPSNFPKKIDVAYYLIHSMSSSKDYAALEEKAAHNFVALLDKCAVERVVYLSGIVNDDKLSKHLKSRKRVEEILLAGPFNTIVFRAGIIIGSGSASFEIIRDLVEKLPFMVAPKWLNTRSQPIAISNVLTYLKKSIHLPFMEDRVFDIGGPDVLTYKEMLLHFAKVRRLKRSIVTVPVMTPKLSSYWLYFVTSTSYPLASALVESMKVEVVCKNHDIRMFIKQDLLTYDEALRRAFEKINHHEIVSSWKDAFASGQLNFKISDFITVPRYGCFRDVRSARVESVDTSASKIWHIGGKTGWYAANALWKMRGFLDKLVGGVGLRRGRTHEDKIDVGDAIDFWRVLYADKEETRLLLFAEMKLPGEAWLEFKIVNGRLVQTATFRPRGILGRLYWYAVLPFHGIVFSKMLKSIASR
ncbi:SDR family oxidoreductase [Lishizhenia sp.]|uniref:SDR family oxidoreductase n=1 Tax=Lishizhenia sp. TaxID=2497594 RepID=UPI00299E0069|nr:SDR family oxidoreductase [Lishizhenia sp.]MDX1446590.1 SDR family oxidoreductase [Lishizhenia sp.]